MPRPVSMGLPAAALLIGLAACDDRPVAPPPAASPLRPLAAAHTPKAPSVTLPPRLVQALQGIEWEPLDYLEYLPKVAYKVERGCTLEYVDTGVLTLSDSVAGVAKHSYFQRFNLEPQGPGRMVRRPAERLEYVELSIAGRRMSGFLDTSRAKQPALTLEVAPEQVTFPSALSPLFGMRGANMGDPSPLHVWPTLASVEKPATWDYNLLFDTPATLATRPPARVAFAGWIRLGLQRAAYLTATWPGGAESLPIAAGLAHVRIQGRMPLSSKLRQLGDIEGHYLVSENGFVLLAHVDGAVRIRNVFDVKRGAKAREHVVEEDRNFSFTTKLISDCNGSLFSKVEAEELSDAEVLELAERFTSLMAIGRSADAAELLSPAIRYAFPDGAPLILIKEAIGVVGTDFLGKPPAENSGPGTDGVLLVGRNRATNRPLYSKVRGARIKGTPVLTFIGTSSKSSRTAWDVLVVEPGNIRSGVVRLMKM